MVLNSNIKIKVQGFKNGNDESKGNFTQLQTLIISDDGVEKIKAIKVWKEIDGASVVGKNVICQNIKEHNIDKFTTYYSADNFKVIDEQLEENFTIDRSLKIKVSNVSNITDKKGVSTSAIYSSGVNEKGALESLKVKIKKPTTLANLEKLKGKSITIKNIKISKINFNTYYSCESVKDISINK
jgi:hypothetical protein